MMAMNYQVDGFEITEDTDDNGRRVLTHISGIGDSFIVPDGTYAISRKAFTDVAATLRKVFIPKSVQIIDQDTFSGYRNPDYSNSVSEKKPPLVIDCESESRPDGFYYKLFEESFQEDYEFYYETYLNTWLGSHYLGTGKWSDDSSGNSYEFLFPAVRWGCKKPR